MKRLLDFFRRPAPPSAPVLRNKVGGYAWIRGLVGDEAPLNGRAVKTVRVQGDVWDIEPEQPIVLTNWVRDATGHVSHPGPAFIVGIPDANLEPWKDTGLTDEEVRELYSPQKTTEPA